jgi:hypothetical protein
MMGRLVLVCGLGFAVACGDDSAPGMDAGGIDAPPVDAPPVDAPGVDAPPVDAPPVDAPGVDSGGLDAGVDSGALDAGGGSDPWRPAPGTTWYWQLQGTIDTTRDVQAYDIDLFDVPDRVITALQDAGRTVICYFSAGSYEEWRSDAGDFPAAALGEPLDGWAGERWLDVRHAGARAVLVARLDLARARGCDAVEPDNVDGYTNDTGFPLRAADQIEFLTFLANEAHARGLSIGLKNDVDQLDALEPLFDWALNEQCDEYDECGGYDVFIDAGKAVFHVEYGGAALAGRVCGRTSALGLSTAIANLDLDGSRWIGCWE